MAIQQRLRFVYRWSALKVARNQHGDAAGDKYGDLNVVNSASMGRQDVNGTSQYNVGNGNFGIYTFALWNRADGVYVYLRQQYGPLAAYLVSANSLDTAPVSTSNATAVTSYGGLAISANGGQVGSGILWEITRDTADASNASYTARIQCIRGPFPGALEQHYGRERQLGRLS